LPELFNVVTPEEARRIFFGHLSPNATLERVAVADALDRITRRDVHSPSDLPAFSRSTMDGYAVRAADTYGATEGIPAYLDVIGEVLMGRQAEVTVSAGQAAIEHTGGMLPAGADAVVMVENTQQVDAATIEVVRPVAPGENVIQVGEDLRRGDLLVPAGRWLRPQDLGGLMGAGVTEIDVAPRPLVAVISTGDEIVPPEEEIGPGQVRDINTHTLSAQIRQAGGVPWSLGIIPDNRKALTEAAERALQGADVVIVTAGSSVSVRDLTAGVIAGLGEPGILVHGVATRPGKPTILAVAAGKPVIGLPGNPVSAMVIFDLLVAPALYLLAGSSNPPARPTVEAFLARNVASTTGREDYVQVRVEERDGQRWAVPVFGESNLIMTMIKADGTVQVPLDKHGLPEGERVTVTLF
jgi:molybdopterin molybdotransferase